MSAIVVVFIGRLLLPRGEETGSSDTGATTEESASSSQSAAFFADLKAGMYSGEIQGIVPGKTVPFALISFPNKQKVAVIVGLEGWQPVLVPTRTSTGEPVESLSVRSNGIVLNFSGELTGDSLAGHFSNALTGQSGSWKAAKEARN